MKTYSRQKTYSRTAEPPAKRRRLIESDASDFLFSHDVPTSSTPIDAPSSPARDSSVVPTSDAAPPSTTPPSSPPLVPKSPVLPSRRPTFSFFARKSAKVAKGDHKLAPLKERNANATSPESPTKATKPSKPPVKKQQRLTQLRLDLSLTPASAQKTCKVCGMAYVPSNDEDAALHKKFHAMNVGGVELGRAFVRGLEEARRVWQGGEDGRDCIVEVVRRDGVSAKNRVQRVMEVVRSELGAVEITEEELWGQVDVTDARRDDAKSEAGNGDKSREQKRGKQETAPRADRFKAYLYIRGTKCIGLCLAERITEAYRVLPTENASTPEAQHMEEKPASEESEKDEAKEKEATAAETVEAALSPAVPSNPTTTSPSPPTAPHQPTLTPTASTITTFPSSIHHAPTPHPAELGISRIWTSSSHRGQGVAQALLAAATSAFGLRVAVDADAIAFSQPTESGARLARRWFGTAVPGGGDRGGWGVYW